LVMGRYPPELQPQQNDEGHWRVACPDLRPLLELNPQVQPLLRDWILRLLSEVPEQRGSAAELAEALEAGAQQYRKVPRPDQAQVVKPQPPVAPAATSTGEKPQRSRVSERLRDLKPWLALATAAGLALMLWSQPWSLSVSPGDGPDHSPGQAQAQAPDAGTAAVGDSVPSSPPSAPPSSGEQSISQDEPFIPDPKQPLQRASPDAKGRCPGRKQVVLNGSCWMEMASMTTEDCLTGGYMFLKGRCYAPVLEIPQKAVPTSAPGDAR
ncbi:MAG TPA: hypothetical protein VF815_17495, partial [Myxococcaceae bacterium]